MNYLIIIFGLVFIFFAMWGSNTRGVFSRNISNFSGIAWLALVVYFFILNGWNYGLIFIIGSFVVGSIILKIMPLILKVIKDKQ